MQKTPLSTEESKKFKRLKKADDSKPGQAPKVKALPQLGEALFGGYEAEPDMEKKDAQGVAPYAGQGNERLPCLLDQALHEEIEGSPSESEEEGVGDFIDDNEGQRLPGMEGENIGDAERRKSGIGEKGKTQGPLAPVLASTFKIAEEIFTRPEEPAEFEEEQKQIAPLPTGKPAPQENQLEEFYEPSELKKQFVTSLDKKIKQTDLPERMQLSLSERLEPTKEELQAEAFWIWKQRKEKDSKDCIYEVLVLYRQEYFEPPFIYTYRKHIYKQLFEKRDIWEIVKLDKEWGYIYDKKKAMSARVKMICEAYPQYSFISDELNNARSIEDIEDIQEFVEFYQSLLTVGKDQGVASAVAKLSRKKRELAQLVQAKIPELGDKILLKSWEYNENMKSARVIRSPPDVKTKVVLLAKEYISELNKELIDEQSVLIALVKYASEEVSVLPYLKKLVRDFYWENAIVSTSPTPKGDVELDVFNPSYRVKYITKRPLTTFQNDLWLDIMSNVEKKFITIKMELEEAKLAELKQRFLQCYMLDEDTKDENVVSSNEKRREIILLALKEYLLPSADGRAKQRLQKIAEDHVIGKCSEQFKSQLMAGPYRPAIDSKPNADDPLSGGEAEEAPADIRGVKAMSLVIDSESEKRPIVQIAMVDENGELIEHHILQNIMHRNSKDDPPAERELYEKDAEECKRIIRIHQPQIIIVSANRLDAQTLKKNLREWAIAENKQDERMSMQPGIDEGKAKIGEAWVTWGDLTIPKIYSVSPASVKQLPSASQLLKAAVSLAHMKQDALSEILNLWSFEEATNGVLSIPFHPMQKLVTSRKLVEELEQIAVDCVNDVGVDINKITEHPFLMSRLSFICGLGPRKAQDIIVTLQQKGKLGLRFELFKKNYLGKTLYKNCAGFLKVIDDSIDNDYLRDPLDQTRIHPENYFIADKIAADALSDDKSEPPISPTDRIQILNRVMKNPKKLAQLDLQRYSESLQREKHGSNAKMMVDFVVQELSFPFKDPRDKYTDLVNEDLFYLLINETKQTFYRGMIVSATVVNAKNPAVNIMCKLENGLDAHIRKEDFMDFDGEAGMSTDPKSIENTVIPARIKQICDSKFSVTLTARKEDLRSHAEWVNINPEDSKYFYRNPHDFENKKMIEEEKRRSVKYTPRSITHKKFKNYTLTKSTEYLSDLEVGEYIFRPSSKGEDHLTLTLKFYKNVYVHIDIKEEEKLPGGTLGQKLIIKTDTYESLDEIIARFVTPIVDYAKEIASHRKFVDAISIKTVEDYLLGEQAKVPNIICYCFTILPENGQYVVLAYSPKKEKVVKEYIKVTQHGYYFHDQSFRNIAALISYFKQHFPDPEYQRWVKKNNKPPTLVVPRREPPAGEQWAGVHEDWRSDPNTTQKSKEPGGWDSMETSKPGEELKTTYLPRTEYDRSTPKDFQMHDTPGPLTEYGNKFSSYESGDSSMGRGRGDSRGDFRRPGRRPMTCYNCNQEGHMSRDCKEPRGRGGRGGRGERGRFSRGGRESFGGRRGGDDFGEFRGRGEDFGGSRSRNDMDTKTSEPWGVAVTSESNDGWGAPAPRIESLQQPTAVSGTLNPISNEPKGDVWGDVSAQTQPQTQAPSLNPWQSNEPSAPVAPALTEEHKAPLGGGFNTIEQMNDAWGAGTSAWGVSAPSAPMDFDRGRSDRGRGDRGRGDRSDRGDGDRGRGRGGFQRGGRGGGSGGRGRGCFNCGEEGHMAKECPTRGSGGSRGRGDRGDRGGSSRGDKNCFKCGKPGHFSRECPEAGESSGRGFRGSDGGRPRRGNRGDYDRPQFGDSDRGNRRSRSRSNERATAGDAWGINSATAGWDNPPSNQQTAPPSIMSETKKEEPSGW